MIDKYVLMKADVFDEMFERIHCLLTQERDSKRFDNLIEDSVVQKDFFAVVEGDVFGPSGLDAYAANIRTGLELLPVFGTEIDIKARTRLEDLADELTVMASKWRAKPAKLPD